MILCVILFTALYGTVQSEEKITPSLQNATKKQFVYNTYPYDTIIHVTVNNNTEQILDFYERSEAGLAYPTRVHVSANCSLSPEYPVFVTATQQKGVSSWELPLQSPQQLQPQSAAAARAADMARTLCPHDADTEQCPRPQLQLATRGAHNVTLSVKLRRVTDFYVPLDKEVVVGNVSPSTPKYYYFSFRHTPPPNGSLHEHTVGAHIGLQSLAPDGVVVAVHSDDQLCALVSVQNNSCPVFDNEKDVLYQGYRLSMTTQGAVTVTPSMFPHGFYLVFIVKQSDEQCTGGPGEPWPTGRVKTFRFTVTRVVSGRVVVEGAAVVVGLLLAVAALAPLLARLPSREDEELLLEVAPGPSTSQETVDPHTTPADDSDDSDDSDVECLLAEGGGGGDGDGDGHHQQLTVAQLCRERPSTLARRSHRYVWGALTVAVVYALPVVQLLLTYQQMSVSGGERDVCYYNSLCALPLLGLADFNHVFSNVGYVVLGAAFALQVRAQSPLPTRGQQLGVPQHEGLLYSLALALAMEGLLSACYHLCPNKMNFQFDSSFMYCTALLCCSRLHAARHGAPHAHRTFLVLAAVMALGVVGVLYPSAYFWYWLTALHLCACALLTAHLYYRGTFRWEAAALSRAVAAARALGWRALVPARRPQMALLLAANAANWALAAYGLYWHRRDVAHQLLAILLGNTLLYALYYVCMKALHGERLSRVTTAYAVAAAATWAVAITFFLQANTKWSETPAQSRAHNAPCLALQLFDSHDVWHLSSAVALYLSLHALLTLDRPLRHTPTHLIPVF